MHLHSIYYFEGINRLAYGWKNPNCAAAFLVTLIPLFWGAQRYLREATASWRYTIALAGGELALTAMVALTYSRGAIIAWLGALLFFAGACRRDRILGFVLARLAVVAGIVAAIGLGRRFSSILNGDASSEHRLELWQGGLQLIDARPLLGWGRGMSGQMYMQWIQPFSRSEVHGGMVSSYLHVAVELGLPALAALIFLLLVPVCVVSGLGSSVTSRDRSLVAGAGAGVAAFAIANVFTTLWLFVSVDAAYFAAATLALAVGVSRGPSGALRSALRRAAFITAACTALIIAAAWAANRHGDWSIHGLPQGAIQVVRHGAVPQPGDPTFVVDRVTLGPYYGKTLRSEQTASSAQFSSFVVYPPGSSVNNIRGNMLFFFGARVANASAGVSANASLFLINPSTAAPVRLAGKPTAVVLPAYDEIGYGHAWREWSKANAVPVIATADTGQQASADWGRILQTCVTMAHR